MPSGKEGRGTSPPPPPVQNRRPKVFVHLPTCRRRRAPGPCCAAASPAPWPCRRAAGSAAVCTAPARRPSGTCQQNATFSKKSTWYHSTCVTVFPFLRVLREIRNKEKVVLGWIRSSASHRSPCMLPHRQDSNFNINVIKDT